MKKTLLSIALLATLAAFITGCAGTLNTSNNDTLRTINVSGTGKVKIKPDIANVNIGVRSQSPEIIEAFRENSEIAENIIQKLMEMGVEQKDIQTRYFNIYQQQEPRLNEEEEPTTNYVVENTVAVIVRDLDALGEVLSTMVSEGANTIHGITFDIEDRGAAVEEARQLAIEDAKSDLQSQLDALESATSEDIIGLIDTRIGEVRIWVTMMTNFAVQEQEELITAKATELENAAKQAMQDLVDGI